ncbi:MAG TPA: tail fiber domain-containing protein [Bacteriovoracaceae bacterium]|nr:tail fiber domain-containing protein [Bacteriovoracaceae bacterium]
MRRSDSQSGMGLIEVMVAAAALAGLALVGLQFSENSQKTVVRLEKGIEVSELNLEVNSMLMNKANCTATISGGFPGTPLAIGRITGPNRFPETSGLQILAIEKDGSVKSHYDMNPNFKRNLVTLEDMYFTGYTPTIIATEGMQRLAHTAILIKKFTYKLGPENISTKTKSSVVDITPDDYVNPTKVVSCVLKSGEADDIWTVADFGIYYDGGTVTIGKETVQVPAKLDVTGGAIFNPVPALGINSITQVAGAENNNNYIFGGYNNTVPGARKNNIILGGNLNKMGNTVENTVVIGGEKNSADLKNSATIGGVSNLASGENSIALGGQNNRPTGLSSAILAGENNTVSGTYSVAIGGTHNKVPGNYSVILGGGGPNSYNMANADKSFVIGGRDNFVSETGTLSGVVGGAMNKVGGASSIVLGGFYNITGNEFTATLGGSYNGATGHRSVAIGGLSNKAYGLNSIALGGNENTVTATGNHAIVLAGNKNEAKAAHSATVGGDNNILSETAWNSSTLGGGTHIITAAGSSIVGGWNHEVMAPGADSGIFVGVDNKVTGHRNAVLAGNLNFIEGISENAVIIGGHDNKINRSKTSIILGGKNNTISNGSYSFAFGQDVKVYSDYSFVFGKNVESNNQGQVILTDAVDGPTFTNGTQNSFHARFTGGYRFCSNVLCSTGAKITGGTNGWTEVSDKNTKKDFRDVEEEKILAKIGNLDIPSWILKDAKIHDKRYVGPMAQDFYRLFAKPLNLNSSDKTINSLDMAGVTLVGVKALEKRTTELRKENAELKQGLKNMLNEIEVLRQELRELKSFRR